MFVRVPRVRLREVSTNSKFIKTCDKFSDCLMAIFLAEYFVWSKKVERS